MHGMTTPEPTALARIAELHQEATWHVETTDFAAPSVCNWCLLLGSPYPVTDERFFDGHLHEVVYCAGCNRGAGANVRISVQSSVSGYVEVAELEAPWPCETWVVATQTPEVYETWCVLVRDREPRAALEQAQALERDEESA